ncbi:hypothetical protein ABHF33_03545 [Chitinibacter sp. FCG-7]|uniref:Uncharacterized protein n=1 Tax=Chitinibacter mangrovi TaxID=3153927 RepID=A0AAU7FCI0_9NEIS
MSNKFLRQKQHHLLRFFPDLFCIKQRHARLGLNKAAVQGICPLAYLLLPAYFACLKG